MNNTETLKLIDGHFVNEEAGEILMRIYSSKINFYNVKNLNSYVRHGCDDEVARQRIASLTEEMAKLQSVMAEAKAKNKRVIIRSQVNISLIDEDSSGS